MHGSSKPQNSVTLNEGLLSFSTMDALDPLRSQIMNLLYTTISVVATAVVLPMPLHAQSVESRDFSSKAPRFTFANSLPEQKAQLRNNPFLQQQRELRQKYSADPQSPAYHFSNPAVRLNDPNGLCYWQGRWHLFYQAQPVEDRRWHWAHAVSSDLIHWRDLPYAIYPDPEEQSYSGSMLIEKDRAIAMYHGRNLGNMVAVSHDPLLLNWEKVSGDTVVPIDEGGRKHHFLSAESLPYRIYDPCIWKEDGTYYSLSGSVDYDSLGDRPVPAEFLFSSQDLVKWEFVHQFLENDRFTQVGDDGACPYFWPIGDRHILLFFSHTSSAQYLLGDYDKERKKFSPTSHGRFNFGPVSPGGVHAPSATPDGKGGVLVMFNMNPSVTGDGAHGIMTLPRRLALVGKDELSIEPAGDIASLRGKQHQIGPMRLPPNEEIILHEIKGNTLELIAEIDPKDAPMVELKVLRSPNREEMTRILLFKDRSITSRFMPPQHKLSIVTLDGTRASQAPDAISRPPETAPVLIPAGEPFRLRVFIDRGVVEVFVNDRQCLAIRARPGRPDSLGISLTSLGQEAQLTSLTAWEMKNIFELGN